MTEPKTIPSKENPSPETTPASPAEVGWTTDLFPPHGEPKTSSTEDGSQRGTADLHDPFSPDWRL